MGITPESVAASFANESRGWVAEEEGRIVAFSIADREKSTIFALFVLPEYEGRGLGTELLARAVNWLWDHEADVLWLTTGSGARAAHFYERAGWTRTGADASGRAPLRAEAELTALLLGVPGFQMAPTRLGRLSRASN